MARGKPAPPYGVGFGPAFNQLAEWLAEWGGDRKSLGRNQFKKFVTTSLPTARVRGWWRVVTTFPRMSPGPWG
jgi:hypothetical protein